MVRFFYGRAKDTGLDWEDVEAARQAGTLVPKTWLEAFDALIKILEASKEQKKVVFLDELSWMNGVDGSFLTDRKSVV